MIALGVSAENLGDAPLHLGEAGEHLLWGDTNTRCVRGGPGLSVPGESQAISAWGPSPVTCCRLAGAAGRLPGRRRRPGPRVEQFGPSSPELPLRGSRPAPRGRERPQPRPPAYTDPRSRRPRAKAHALTDLVWHPRPLVTAPCSNGTSQWPSRETGRKAAPGVPGAVRGPAPRPARACPARCRCGRPNPEARPRHGSPPALTIYSQALGSEAAAPRACADIAPPLARARPGSDA